MPSSSAHDFSVGAGRLPHQGRVLFALFIGWSVGVSVLVAGLARAGCVVDATAEGSLPAGWVLRHDLDPRHPDSDHVARLLLEHRPRQDGRESIVLHGDGGSLRRRLQSAGWTVTDAAQEASDLQPRLHVIAPDGAIAWTGFFNPSDLSTPGAMILSSVVLNEVTQGRMPPPLVPVACTTPPESI